jgi:hypothetical protein
MYSPVAFRISREITEQSLNEVLKVCLWLCHGCPQMSRATCMLWRSMKMCGR